MRAELPPYRVEFTHRAARDVEQLALKLRAKLTDIVRNRTAVEPQIGKRLVGELQWYWSLRLTLRDRIVYRIDEASRTVYILRTRAHYAP